MTQILPIRASLANLKKQAKQLLKHYRENKATAKAKILSYYPQPEMFSTLRDAQLVIAREYGFSGWSELKTAVEEAALNSLTISELTEQFIELACLQYNGTDSDLRHQRATRLLDKNPQLATYNIITAVISNNLLEVEKRLTEAPDLAVATMGPQNWTALMYLSYSRINERSGNKTALDIARLLLTTGADVNAYVLLDDEYRFSVLTGAMGEGEGGLNNQPPHQYSQELATLLLDAGANPVEFQGLYNTMFTNSLDNWLPLLMKYGLSKESLVNDAVTSKNTVYNFLLATAVSRDKISRVNFLLSQGADANTECRYTNRKMHTISIINQHSEITRLLLDSGATVVPLTIEEQFMLAIATDDKIKIQQLVEKQIKLLDTPDFYQRATIEALQLLIELGLDINRQDSAGRSLLHLLAIHGQLEQIDFLIEQGARVDLRDTNFNATVVAWAHFNNQIPVRDYLLERSSNAIELAACGKLELLQQLLNEKPLLATRASDSGFTPLHLVCNWLGTSADYKTRALIIDLLIASGADINAKNKKGLTPLEVYKQENDEDNIELILGVIAQT